MKTSDYVQTLDQIQKAYRLYLSVGLVLFCGMGITIAILTMPWLDVGRHGFDRWDALLGIVIAAINALLVALVLRHFLHERRLIYGMVAVAAAHALGFFIGNYWHYAAISFDSYLYKSEEATGGLAMGVCHSRQGKSTMTSNPVVDTMGAPRVSPSNFCQVQPNLKSNET